MLSTPKKPREMKESAQDGDCSQGQAQTGHSRQDPSSQGNAGEAPGRECQARSQPIPSRPFMLSDICMSQGLGVQGKAEEGRSVGKRESSSSEDKSSSLDSDEDLNMAIKNLLRSKQKLKKRERPTHLRTMAMGNGSTVTEFTLMAFPALLEIRILLFVVLLLTYTLTATGNLTIISLIWTDSHLQTPMYFFLMEFILLAVMSFDRYVAICNPLRYTLIMNSRTSFLLVLGCWVACIDTRLIEKINFLLSALVILSSLAFTTGSYSYIISTILRMPSARGRQKAFSTCAAHITVVSIAYGSNIFVDSQNSLQLL
ncbi:Hypothetical predicted protein [Marmota monax]|uniref:G-protein coupled receptors family 1 profile domain-containing protein n=1 Tax=Marmota monax TaxID=9995 RepID=A0A5E4AQB4_MARMO|nr:Hypothetical predicted protein [Marmota monax]